MDTIQKLIELGTWLPLALSLYLIVAAIAGHFPYEQHNRTFDDRTRKWLLITAIIFFIISFCFLFFDKNQQTDFCSELIESSAVAKITSPKPGRLVKVPITPDDSGSFIASGELKNLEPTRSAWLMLEYSESKDHLYPFKSLANGEWQVNIHPGNKAVANGHEFAIVVYTFSDSELLEFYNDIDKEIAYKGLSKTRLSSVDGYKELARVNSLVLAVLKE